MAMSFSICLLPILLFGGLGLLLGGGYFLAQSGQCEETPWLGSPLTLRLLGLVLLLGGLVLLCSPLFGYFFFNISMR